MDFEVQPQAVPTVVELVAVVLAGFGNGFAHQQNWVYNFDSMVK